LKPKYAKPSTYNPQDGSTPGSELGYGDSMRYRKDKLEFRGVALESLVAGNPDPPDELLHYDELDFACHWKKLYF